MRRKRYSKAFTLIEILVVVVIIGVLATLIVPRFFGRVGQAKIAAAASNIQTLGTIIDTFKLDQGRFPTELAELVECPSDIDEADFQPYCKAKDLLDAWRNEYAYECPGSHNKGSYDLYSMGADGAEGGEGENADIVNW